MKFSAAFVLGGLSALAAVGASSSGFEIVKRSNQDIEILQFALTLEHLETYFFTHLLPPKEAFEKEGFSGTVYDRMKEVGAQEAEHVALLSATLKELGAKPTEPCTYQFPGVNDAQTYLAMGSIFESVGQSAYIGASGAVTSKEILEAAASILSIEAAHYGEIRTFEGVDGAPAPYVTPLQMSQVYSLAAPFIKSCPSSNPKLPVKDFPILTIAEVNPYPGQNIRMKFRGYDAKNTYYVHFLNGLSTSVAKLDSGRHAHIPKEVSGTVYVVVSTSKDDLTDKNTVAGPAMLHFAYGS